VWNPSAPGTYRFLVEARNEDGIWSAEPTVLALVLVPAWWQSTAARLAGAVALLALLAGAYRLRIRTLERRHAAHLRAVEERRAAEERAAALRSQLEHVARVALAGELAANLAHEVNQPLTAIVSNAQTGKRFLSHYLTQPAELEEILSEIATQGLRASEVIRSLRGFVRGGDVAPAPVDLSTLVREMLPLMRRELEQNGVEVELALAGDLPLVEGSRTQLGQVVINLVMNACEALAAVAPPRNVSITTRTRDAQVELAVRDNGPGVAGEHEARLFQPFFTSKPEGMGMGLAICRSIAEAHGGRLIHEAPAAGGACFVLSLPGPNPEIQALAS
jgi:C4-dicarboxylate-specific signal transduction histidine kinase